jgi:hypothetical protein
MKALLGLLGGIGALYFMSSRAKAKEPNIPKPHEPKPATHIITSVDNPIPNGWRLLKGSEMTPELIKIEEDVRDAHFTPGTVNYFDLDDKNYAVIVRDDATISLIIKA